MDKARVALVKCDSYDEDAVYGAVKSGLKLLGGAKQFVGPGERLLLKPNVLAGDHPDRCIGPHPSILKAAGKIFREVSANLTYGDSPSNGSSASHLQKAHLSLAAEEIGLSPADFNNGREIVFKDSPFTRKFVIANGVLEAEGLISLAKLKTHMLTRMTGAVKNQFGCIPGRIKAGYHLKMPDAHDFARMLVALNLFIKPRIFIMDGIVAMEGNGPRRGNPVKMNLLLFSNDPVALDAVMCSTVELNPEYVPTMKPGREWGLGTYLPEEIKVVGDSIDSVRNGDFRVDRRPFKNILPQGMMAFAKNFIAQRPVIDREKCLNCGICVEACPVDPKAVDWHHDKKKQPPTYKYMRCIRCFCCQEMCPEGAITVLRSSFQRRPGSK